MHTPVTIELAQIVITGKRTQGLNVQYGVVLRGTGRQGKIAQNVRIELVYGYEADIRHPALRTAQEPIPTGEEDDDVQMTEKRA